MNNEQSRIEMRGTRYLSLIPMVGLMISAIIFFVILDAGSMLALALGAVIGLIVCSFFAKDNAKFWDAVVRGMSDESANIINLILIFAGIYAKMMAHGNVAGGFVWLGDLLHLRGAAFCVFTYIAVTIIATSTGSSMGSVLAASAVMYPAGVLLGVDNVVLMGAIISGGLTGDTIGPVSDVTIASCLTQKYSNKEGTADIPGSIMARIKYSAVIAVICIIVFAITGGGGSIAEGYDVEVLIAENSDPRGLLMLISVIALLAVAVKTRNTFLSIAVGVLTGTVIGLASGVFTVSSIISVTADGALSGFVADGISGVLETLVFVYMMFATIGVLRATGTIDDIIARLNRSKFAGTVVGAEIIIMVSSILCGVAMCGDNTPAILLCGPVADELGRSHKLHPYRRANLLSAFTSSLSMMSPVSSFFIFLSVSISLSLQNSYPFIPEIVPTQMPFTLVFCWAAFVVYLFSIITGWGRIYEGPQGEPVKAPPTGADHKNA